jgi:hypothetical protein
MWSKQDAYQWLETIGRRVGLFILILSIISVSIAYCSLRISMTNYDNQKDADRPFIVPANNQRSGASMVFYWTNVGLQTGTRGSASLYSVPDNSDKMQKLSEADIVGAGRTLLLRAGASTSFPLSDMKQRKGALYLVCMKYFDQAGTSYRQQFLFRLVHDDTEGFEPMQEVPLGDARDDAATICQTG